MPREKLPEDPESLEKWTQLSQNTPSKQAMPPAMGGLKLTWVLLLGFAVLIILALVFQLFPS
jgi:hypothetical protein